MFTSQNETEFLPSASHLKSQDRVKAKENKGRSAIPRLTLQPGALTQLFVGDHGEHLRGHD